ncbi:MAG TPA: YfiR family protein [Candidatus Acidoferrales bacterium]|nr:YfiR family protein [Candidatus Acidoferrales bacterium]
MSFALACASTLSGVIHAQQSKPSEYQVKAAYLYNFSRFVEWPAAERGEPFAICVLGKDPFGTILDATVSGQGTGTQNLVAKRVTKPQDALACQILFVGNSEEDHLKEILAVLGKASVLTVSDIPRFSERGGMIEFLLKGDRVRFEVNLSNAVNAGLSVSSDLLKVALAVRKNPQSGA